MRISFSITDSKSLGDPGPSTWHRHLERESSQDVVVDPDPDPPSQASQHRQDGREYGTKVREETKTLASYPCRGCQTRRAPEDKFKQRQKLGDWFIQDSPTWVTSAVCRQIVLRASSLTERLSDCLRWLASERANHVS